MDFLKKVSIPAYLFVASAVISFVAMIIAAVSSSDEGFGMPEFPAIVVLTIACIILSLAIVFLSGKYGDSFITTILAVAMVICSTFCVYAMVFGKMQVFGTVLFSDLEKGYAPAERACSLGIASIVIYLIGALTAVVGGFFKLSKNNNA